MSIQGLNEENNEQQTQNAQANAPAKSGPAHLDIKKMNSAATPQVDEKEEKKKQKELEKQKKQQEKELEKQKKQQEAAQNADEQKDKKPDKKPEKKQKEKKEKENLQSATDPDLLKRTDAVNEFFKTPPAGVYPKTDSQGRVIKYKKRGGVFAFFVGIFFSLFLFVFCGGLALSYFYYCYKIEDAGKTLGVDMSFLPEDTKNKTASELVSLLMDYKDGYVNMTVQDAKDKLGLDIEEVVQKNLGIEIQDFNEIELTLKNVNDGNKIKVKDIRLQDILNNTQDFVNALLPELYKKVSVSAILDLASIQINLDKPLVKDEIFDVNPNPTFVLGEKTYKINYAKKMVEISEEEFQTELKDGKFKINSVEYTISDDRTKLLFEGGEITLKYDHNYKKLNDLTVSELLSSIIPNYIGGENLTLKFIQNALSLDLVDETNPEFASLLNTSINTLKIDKVLDAVSLRSFEKLVGTEIIPLDDERYSDVLDQKIGQITFKEITENLKMGAFLDLLKVSLPDLPFLTYDEFKNTPMSDVKDYVYTLKVSDFVKNIIDEVHPHSYFIKDGINYYVDEQERKVFLKNQIDAAQNSQFAKIGDEDIYSYIINSTEYLMYKDYLYKNKSSNIISNTVQIGDKTYSVDLANSKLTNTEDSSDVVSLTDSNFVITKDSRVEIFGKFTSTQAVFYQIKEESKVTGRIFRINFEVGVDEGFVEDTTLTFKLDKQNNIEFMDEQATIDSENNFTIGGTTFTLNDTSVSDGTNTFELNKKSSTTDILLYAVSDLTVKNVIDGDLKPLISGDAKLSNLLLTDVLNKEFSGLLKNLNGLTIGEIVDTPDVLIDRIKTITLTEIMGIDDSSSPLLKAIADENLTIDDLMKESSPGEENPIIKAMGKVTFFELGVKNNPTYLIEDGQVKIGDTVYTYDEPNNKFNDGTNDYVITTVDGKQIVTLDKEYRFIADTKDSSNNIIIGKRLVENSKYNPLIAILEKVKISDVMAENGLYNIIKDIKLSDMTESDSGIMSILGDITFEDFGGGDAITNKLKSSNNSLAELLDKTIYFYDHFTYDNNLYYFVNNMNTLNGLYSQTNRYDITFTYNTHTGKTVQTFVYEDETYTLDLQNNRLKKGNTTVIYAGNNVEIINNTFVFVNNKIFIISGSYVYELTKSDKTFTISGTTITEFDSNTGLNIEITPVSTLNKAILSLKVCDLFGGDFTESLTKEVQNIQLVEILGDVSGNKLLNAIITQNPNVTINSLGSTINNLTMGEVFADADFSTGILSLISYNGDTFENTKLVDAVNAINDFSFGNVKMGDLVAKGVVDFGANNNKFVQYDGSGNIKYNPDNSYDSTYGNYTFVSFVNFILDNSSL